MDEWFIRAFMVITGHYTALWVILDLNSRKSDAQWAMATFLWKVPAHAFTSYCPCLHITIASSHYQSLLNYKFKMGKRDGAEKQITQGAWYNTGSIDWSGIVLNCYCFHVEHITFGTHGLQTTSFRHPSDFQLQPIIRTPLHNNFHL